MSKNNSVVTALSAVLADTYILALKTQNYHWNVTGPSFAMLHDMFGKQYADLSATVDILAERIRALGVRAPGSFAAFSKLTSLREETGSPSALTMIKNLAKDHETAVAGLKKALSLAQKSSDEATADMLIERIEWHEKTIWMLSAHSA